MRLLRETVTAIDPAARRVTTDVGEHEADVLVVAPATADLSGNQVVVKQMHNEPCAYYQFGDNKVRLEVSAYHRLRSAGVALAELIAFDEEQLFLVKEYCAGTVADHWTPTPAELDAAVCQLFRLANHLKHQHLNIDYFPANFVITNTGLRYIDSTRGPIR